MGRPRASLFVASFLMLFVELALIRGTTAADVYLSFFTNLVLLASFLGSDSGSSAPGGSRRAPMGAAVAVGRAAVLAALPGADRPRRRPHPRAPGVRHHACPSGMAVPVRDLPRSRRGDGRDRRAGRATVRGVRPARRVPARRPREHRWDRRVLDVVVRGRGTVALDRHRDRCAALPPTGRAHPRGRRRSRGAAGAGRDQLVAAARHLVAVPARHVRGARRRSGGDPREQPSASDHGAPFDPARRATLLRISVRASAGRPRRRPDRRSGQRQRRGDRAVGRGDAHRRGRDRPGVAAAGTRCTRTIRIRTRA